MSELIDTPTIKYKHPLLDEAVKRGFVTGAKYLSLCARETRYVSSYGVPYYDTLYREIVVGGFVIARHMDFKLEIKPEYFAWSEIIYPLEEMDETWAGKPPTRTTVIRDPIEEHCKAMAESIATSRIQSVTENVSNAPKINPFEDLPEALLSDVFNRDLIDELIAFQKAKLGIEDLYRAFNAGEARVRWLQGKQRFEDYAPSAPEYVKARIIELKATMPK